MILCSLERMKEKIAAFSYFGKTDGGGITRRSLSPAALAARVEIKRRMEKLGLTVTTDDLSDHAGTFPMPLRKDAFYAACKVLEYIHTEFDKLDSKLVYTTDKFRAIRTFIRLSPTRFRSALMPVIQIPK